MDHITPQELAKKLLEAQEKVPLLSVWSHHKGSEFTYSIVGFDIDSESKNVRVHYKPTYMKEQIIFSHFIDDFTKKIIVDRMPFQRFKRIK